MGLTEKKRTQLRKYIHENQERAVKEYINKFLRFMKSLKANTKKDNDVHSFICKIDKKCADILLDDKCPICKRAKILHESLAKTRSNKRLAIKRNGSNVYHKKTLEHLSTILSHLEELEFVSDVAVIAIRYRDVKTRQVFALDKQKVENIDCKFYPEGDHDICLCGMDMVYCSKNCAYATTLPDKLRSTYNEDGYVYIGGGEQGAILWGKGRKKSPLPHSPIVQQRQKEDYWKHYLRDEVYDKLEGRKD